MLGLGGILYSRSVMCMHLVCHHGRYMRMCRELKFHLATGVVVRENIVSNENTPIITTYLPNRYYRLGS